MRVSSLALDGSSSQQLQEHQVDVDVVSSSPPSSNFMQDVHTGGSQVVGMGESKSRNLKRRHFGLFVSSSAAAVSLMSSASWLTFAQPAFAAASPGVVQDARELYAKATDAFKQGDVKESAKLFDAALSLVPEAKPRLWQRGIALYYADRFGDGEEQFRDDAKVNTSDTEEAIWAVLCASQRGKASFESAAADIVDISNERRPVLRQVYKLFANQADLDSLLALKKDDGGNADFYALLYAGLYCEARGSDADSLRYIEQALATRYARSSGDFMVDVGRVHVNLRR